MLPEDGCTLTVAIRGNGIAGTTLCTADYWGNVKGYIQNPMADAPLKSNGKLDVSGIVGGGILSVSKDVGDEVPFNGNIELVSGEVAEDITSYYATSEQTPTLCALGVLVDTDFTCRAAGGVMIQLLPFADDEVVTQLEKNATLLNNVSAMFDKGMSNEEILKVALTNIEFDIFDELDIDYKCNCSRQRTEKALISLGKKESYKILDEQKAEGIDFIELSCHFCDKTYKFDKGDIDKLFADK
jgi:molecular chaperone Hsp33